MRNYLVKPNILSLINTSQRQSTYKNSALIIGMRY